MTALLTLVWRGRQLQLTPGQALVTIGRDPKSDVVLDEPSVSRRHAEMRYLHGGWTLVDLGSKNGIWVDGRRVEGSIPITVDSTVRFGDVLSIETRVEGGGERPRLSPATQTITVGRDPDAVLPLSDPMASWHHARLERTSDGWYLRDLGSTNQTLVNGVAVRDHLLAEGDRILFGHTLFVWSAGRLERTELNGFVVDHASWGVANKTIVNDISFRVPHASVTAIIGPSGAGKSSLLRLLTGQTNPSSGTVSFAGATMASQRVARRGDIGVVPQYTVAHGSLTARQVLGYAAQLRLPRDSSADECDAKVADVLTRMSLGEHADTRVGRMSGGQQRRVGIAMELLTDPSMLILDEPTAGLDPSLVLQIMRTLRELADAGTRILVVTHDLEHLTLVDQVVVLRAGGTLAYQGPPDEVFTHFGTSSWAETFELLSTPDTESPVRRPRTTTSLGSATLPAATTPIMLGARHARIIAQRQVRLVATDRVYLGLLVAMPIMLGVLALAVPGGDGLRVSQDPSSTEATKLLVLLVVGAAFLGLSGTIRDLVSERPIFLHERGAGLSPLGYLLAKVLVFTVLATLQAIALVELVTLVRAGPADPLVMPSGDVELALVIAAIAVVCVALGLAVSSRVRTSEQAMPPLVLLVMAQLVLCGGLFPVDGRGFLAVVSALSPTRWAYAAAAASTDLNSISAAVDPDPLFTHSVGNWVGCVVVLLAMWAIALVGAAAGLITRREVE